MFKSNVFLILSVLSHWLPKTTTTQIYNILEHKSAMYQYICTLIKSFLQYFFMAIPFI